MSDYGKLILLLATIGILAFAVSGKGYDVFKVLTNRATVSNNPTTPNGSAPTQTIPSANPQDWTKPPIQ